MTQDEFDATRWRAGINVVYEGSNFVVAGCNFREKLVRLTDDYSLDDDDHWVRCENVEFVSNKT